MTSEIGPGVARSRDLKISIVGDSRRFSRGVKDAEGDLLKLNRVGVSSTRGLSAAFRAAGGVIAGAAIADQIRQTVVAAQEAEVSQKKLATQLKASGISYQAHAKQIDTVIQKTSQLAGLDDEDLQDAFTNIVRVTGNVNQSLRLTGLAADFARAKHLDVAKAGEIVGKVAGGNIGVLSRYGITIRKGASATEALGALQKKFAGQAAAYGKTSAGAQDRFRVAVENLRESIGAKLLPVITRLTNKAADFVNQMQDGTGAGGRFAAKLKDIADRVRPIAKFFADHPRLIAGAVAAWATYRIAVAAATTASRLKLLGMFTGLGPKAAVGGAVAGRSFGGAAATSAGTTFSRRAPGAFRGGRMTGAMRGAGTVLGAVMGAAIVGELISHIEKDRGTILNTIRGLMPFQPTPGGLPKHRPAVILGPHDPEPSGPKGPSSATGRPTPLPSHPSAGSQNAPDNRPRAHSSRVRAHAASTGGTDFVSAVEREASRIDAAHVPYQWGGGHGGRAHPGGKVIPMDCSGAVSAVLGIDPRVSGDFETWGSPGDGGSTGITIYANRTHVLMKINGRFWGTSRSNPGGGPGWIQGGISAGYLRGFTARHLKSADNVRTPSRSMSFAQGSRPVQRLAVAGGILSRASRGMGGALPKDLRKSGFMAAPTQAQIEGLSGDPQTNPLSRQMRLYAVASRINQIDEAIRSGRARTPATIDRLLEERRGLIGERDDLLKPIETPDTSTDTDTGEDSNQAQVDATNANTDAITEHTNAVKALKDSIDEQTQVAKSTIGTSLAAAQRALADILSGEITGSGYDPRAMTAGAGALTRY